MYVDFISLLSACMISMIMIIVLLSFSFLALAGLVVQEPVPGSRSHTVDFWISCWGTACTPSFVRWMLPVNLAVIKLIWEVSKALCRPVHAASWLQ